MKLRDDVLVETLSEVEAVALDLSAHRFFSLNETGARIVALLASGNSQAEVAKTLADEFAIDLADAEQDVEEFVRALSAQSLLDEDPA